MVGLDLATVNWIDEGHLDIVIANSVTGSIKQKLFVSIIDQHEPVNFGRNSEALSETTTVHLVRSKAGLIVLEGSKNIILLAVVLAPVKRISGER